MQHYFCMQNVKLQTDIFLSCCFFYKLVTFCRENPFFGLDFMECGANNPCHANAKCNEGVGTFTCTCMPGYSGDGVNCEGDYISRVQILQIR